jgi:hypothetical protein
VRTWHAPGKTVSSATYVCIPRRVRRALYSARQRRRTGTCGDTHIRYSRQCESRQGLGSRQGRHWERAQDRTTKRAGRWCSKAGGAKLCMRSRIHTVQAPEQACCFLPRLSRLASHLPRLSIARFVLFRGAGLFKRTQSRSGGCSKPSLEMGAGRRTDSDARDVSYFSESVGTNSGPESAATRLLRARRRCLYHQNVVHRAPPRRCHSAAASCENRSAL